MGDVSQGTQTSSQGRTHADVCELTVLHLCARRNKRCLLAYHQSRILSLQDSYWQTGANLIGLLEKDDIRSKLSESEMEFMRGYNKLLSSYKEEL